MLITDNFAILNILQALEKLSAASKDKKADGNVVGGAEDTSDNAADAAAKCSACVAHEHGSVKKSEYTQMLLERHERLANKVKNGKR